MWGGAKKIDRQEKEANFSGINTGGSIMGMGKIAQISLHLKWLFRKKQ
jgi:hypothetical protein